MLAMSIPTHMLKKTPDSSDGLAGGPNGSGQGWVWPAHGADNAANSDWTGPSGIQSQLRRITNNVPGPGGFRQFLDINQDPPVWRTGRWPVNHDTVLGGGVRRRPPAPDFEE